ncbi:hypothetical protein [Rhodoferax sp.]|uniref:hypothetical protein n=1 Tax=Rhodoferax sp. TaxID=50421 RepID=UPI00268ACE2D|nr:hypothetical protein [Rhodoferax sp.]MDO8318140.1 hypothetical protein [Rhodoferax sp.]
MKNEPRIPRSSQDLKASLVEQVLLLMAYCDKFDQGVIAFAKPIAGTLRTLLHHHGNSKSVLAQLSLRSGRYFTVTPPVDPKNLIGHCNLLSIRVDASGVTYVPQFDLPMGGKSRIPFPEWWTLPVAMSQDRKTLSRMDIVTAVADMDGGSHIDPSLTPIYESFRSGRFLGWMAMIDEKEGLPVASPQYSCLRVISHELLLSLEKYAPWSFSKPYVYPGRSN